MLDIRAEPMDPDAFAPFGDVIEADGAFRPINGGRCRRYHDIARLDFGPEGRAGLSIFVAEPRALPYDFDLIERHPDGSQAFIPMSEYPFLVIVSQTVAARPRAFFTAPGQGVNFHRATWHGVLAPLHGPGRFAVIDRIGPGANLEEYRYDAPWRVSAP